MRQYRGASIISHRDLELTLFIFMFARFQSSFLSTVLPCKFSKNSKQFWVGGAIGQSKEVFKLSFSLAEVFEATLILVTTLRW